MHRLTILLVIGLLVSACGKKMPLVYPDMLLPAAPASVSAQQSGTGIRLSFTLPDKDRSGHRLKTLAGVNILRRELSSGQQVCNACSEGFSLFKKVYLDFHEGFQRYGNLIVLLDVDVSPGGSYSYKITPFTKDSLDGETSVPVKADVVSPPPGPSLQIQPAPTEIRLAFTSMPPLTGTFVGYNLYRAPKGDILPYLPLNRTPVAENSYIDRGLDRDIAYRYAARMVVRLPSGATVEGFQSNEVEGALKNEEE
jgi:hypothetical protein